MNVDDPGERRSILVSVKEFNPVGGETKYADERLRCVQEKCDRPQNVGIVRYGVIKSRGIDESHRSPVESELVRSLDLGRTRLWAHREW